MWLLLQPNGFQYGQQQPAAAAAAAASTRCSRMDSSMVLRPLLKQYISSIKPVPRGILASPPLCKQLCGLLLNARSPAQVHQGQNGHEMICA